MMRWADAQHTKIVLRRAIVAIGLMSVGLALALGLGAPKPGFAERSYAGAVGLVVWGAAFSIAFRRLARGEGSLGMAGGWREGQEFPAESTDPAIQERLGLERDLRLGRLTIGDFDLLLKPRLRALATARAGRYGVPLSSVHLFGDEEGGAGGARGSGGAEGARRAGVLGARSPEDRAAPGVPLEQVSVFVSQMEEMK